jgi:hypothetical protein
MNVKATEFTSNYGLSSIYVFGFIYFYVVVVTVWTFLHYHGYINIVDRET